MQRTLVKFIQRLAELIATGLGAGYVPVAPATAGSAVALVLYWALPFQGRGDSAPFFWAIGGLIVIGTGAAAAIIPSGPSTAGLPSGASDARRADEKDQDPSRCVIDEFAGMWMACIFLPVTWGWMLAAFIAFRVLDILKPFGIRRLEKLPGAFGVMADDVAAGLVAAAGLNAVRLIFFG